MGIGIDDVQQKCLICSRDCKNRRSLGNHIAKSHLEIVDTRDYVLKYVLFGVIPKCKCGCDQNVSWHNVRYRFNDYVNGHNDTGFKVKQPIFTKEQIDKRNKAIKKAYSERSEEISEKISKAVNNALQNSNRDFSEYFKNKWQDEEFRTQQHQARVKSWQGEAGEKRRKKVFTKEFGRKIGLANMARDVKQVSRVEQKLIEHLLSIGLNVESSKWFNFTEKTWCVDAWLPDFKIMIELDGIYWHGLDRQQNFTYNQIINITNDLIKNKIAIDRKLNLIRLREDLDLSRITSVDDLKIVAYHVVDNGVVVKEGTFKIDDSTPLIDREVLIKQNKISTDPTVELLNATKEFLRAYVHYWNWFYPPETGTLKESLDSLSCIDQPINSMLNSTKKASRCKSTAWLKSYVKAYWNVDNGPVEKFKLDNALTNVLRYRFGLNNSKLYTYEMSDGSIESCKETFHINFKNIRKGFIVQRNNVSWFHPRWAAQIYKYFLKDKENPTVWDPSIGFSARMLGFASVVKSGTYVGTDPAIEMFDDARRLSNDIKKYSNVNFELFNHGSEKLKIRPNTFDLVFTSPPYFDLEKYFNEPGQCWLEYPSLDEWTKKYLLPTLEIAKESLKIDGHVILNVNANLADLIKVCANEVGLKHADTLYIELASDHFRKKSSKTSERFEPFLVFSN